MSRESSPYVVGDFWLDFRRDGKAKGVYQIARYAPGSRSVIYRSTRSKDLERAKSEIHGFVAEERAKGKQDPHDARVIPMLALYWQEKGRGNINHDQTRRSLRTFMAFLGHDRVGFNAVLTDMVPTLFERFRKWRMGPHSFDLEWDGVATPYQSKGVSGDTVARNLNDVRAALNHAEENRRVPYAPKVKTVDQRHLNPLRKRVLTLDELARILWYAKHYPELFRFVTLQLATAVRPDAAKVFDPEVQYDDSAGFIDLHPEGNARTKKRNAMVPAIRPFQPVLRAWARDGAKPAGSRKTAWRTMRAVLGLSADVYPKTIRHTVATMLYNDSRCPPRQVSELLGHDTGLARTTMLYAKYDPAYMAELRSALTRIWLAVRAESRRFAADHRLTTGRGPGGKILAREVRKR